MTMTEGISLLSLAASGYYLLVALVCALAAYFAQSQRQPLRHKTGWAALAVLFLALIFLRGFGLEEWLRDLVRGVLRSEGDYAGRRDLQSILVSIVLVTCAAIGFWWFYRATRGVKGRRNIALLAAQVSGGAMALLVLVRLVSLHMIDRMLYGPLKINWLADIGTTSVVLVAAVIYIRLVRLRA